MNVVEPGSPGENLIKRAGNILLRPDDTWDVIEAEPADIGDLYRTYVAPLAAIPAVCGAVGLLSLGGVRIFGVRLMPSVGTIIVEMLGRYALTLVSVYVMAVVIDELAPRFGAIRGRTQAFKLAAYSGTASWVAGIFMLLPTLGGLLAFLGGLYSLYLLYLGLPKIMQPEPERAMPYYFMSLAVAFLLMVLIGALSSCFGGLGGPVSI